ncbi:DUF2024 family protein [Patiriisocius hiemis]|uniref:DUF2024 family protein n=1 Tax=Patiriisocius hiemis TaxID=3075604 RepID=A0ABU2YAP4_9FLAO|nr:DUF2024 family protein [Constantimarinum sp. W242]MDT0555261.1 DUF2024 family protein [Constantimarinum sp. W242]
MKVSVWDTYIQREDGKVMHFDILVPSEVTDEEIIFGFGKKYLKTKPFTANHLKAKECRFCHIEQATEQIITSIENVGFHIIEMENCD